MLITGARAPVALDLAHSFAAAGYEPHLADCITPIAAKLSIFGRRQLHRYASPRRNFAAFASGLGRLKAELDAEQIVPVCEEVFYVAAANLSCEVFAPSLPWLRRLHSKHDFIGIAAACGFRVPRTERLMSAQALDKRRPDAASLVFKPEFSRFATRTLIRPSQERLACVAPAPFQPWVAQDYVEGEELCLWSAAIDGVVVAFAAYRPRWRLGRAAAYYFEPADLPEGERFCQAIAAMGPMTGQLAFDVILTPAGDLVPLECNPRGTSGIHLFHRSPDLPRALMGGPRARPDTRPAGLGTAMAVLGLPQALRTGRSRQFVSDWRRMVEVQLTGKERVGALLDAARFGIVGLLHRRSPAAQSTVDLEWNGEVIA